MEVPIKLLDNYKLTGVGDQLPYYANEGDAGMDLRAAISRPITLQSPVVAFNSGENSHWKLIPTGISMAVPYNFKLEITPRSGLALKNGLTVLNTPGTIDPGYRNEIGVILGNWNSWPQTIHPGDRIAQMILVPIEYMELEVVDELPDSKRGLNGYGSSGIR